MSVSVEELKAAVEQSWGPDTCFDADEWTAQNPARGQCIPTSLVVQHYLGGDLRKLETTYEGHEETHYYNVLPDGQEIDFSRQQYPANQLLTSSEVNLHGHKSIREKMMAEPATVRHYGLLLARVTGILGA